MDFLKTIGGKIASGLVGLAVIAGGISWFQMDPATRHMITHGAGQIIIWLLIVGIAPGAVFYLIGRVAKLESNAAGAVLVVVLTAIEAALLGWLFGWSIHGATAITFFAAAALLAGVYNLFVCDWIAEKLE